MVRQQLKLGFSIIEWSKSSEKVDALSRRQKKKEFGFNCCSFPARIYRTFLAELSYTIDHSTITIHLVNVSTSTFC